MVAKKNLQVQLQVAEIFYDVANKTYLTGRSRNAENGAAYEMTSHMEVSADEENSYQIRRSINNSFNDLKTELAEYVLENKSTVDNLVKDIVDNDGVLVLELQLPSNFNNAAADAVASGLHQYIVNRSIADWFIITNKADASDYVSLAAQTLENAKRALYKRARPQRPTEFPTVSAGLPGGTGGGNGGAIGG